MKKSSRIALLLAALLVTQTFAACGDSETSKTDGDTTTAAKPVDPYEGWLLDDLPSDLKFEG